MTVLKMPMLERLTRNELSVLKNINNENIIKFIEKKKTSRNTYYVYEYCNGGSLFNLLEKKKIIGEKQAIIYFK